MASATILCGRWAESHYCACLFSTLVWKIWRVELVRGFTVSYLAELLLVSWCGRGRGWYDLGEWHWNMYNIIYEMNRQSRFDAWYWMLGAGALRRPRGMVWGEGFRMGNMRISVAGSCWCMAKPIQYCNVINLQLK